LWDAYQKAATPDDLAAALKPLKLPNPLKADLWDLKAAPGATSPPPRPAAPSEPASLGQMVTDVGTGIVKGAANTAIGLGNLAYQYLPPVRAASDLAQRAIFGDVQPAEPLFQAARQAVQPTNLPQALGYHGEQIGEFFVPAGYAGRGLKAVEALKAGATTLAQTGDPTTAGVAAGLTAVLPGAATASRAAGALERSAQKSVAGALGATKEWAKTEAAQLAPEMLARGVKGSRAEMLAQAKTAVADVGSKIGAEIQALAGQGQTIQGPIVSQAIQTARDALHVSTPQAGAMLPIAGTEPVIRQLDKLGTFVRQLGPDIPIDQAAKIKTVWDRIVSKAGLYGPKAQASATDSAAAWSIREAASSFRNLLAQGSPTLDQLNKEYAFWKGVRGVLTETERRTQAQGAGLISGVTGGAGVIGGLISGKDVEDKLQNALIYGLAGRQLVRLLQSPAWATRVSAPLKQALADALASQSSLRVTSATQRILSSLPAQVRSTLTSP
jgi:hypothetical protein